MMEAFEKIAEKFNNDYISIDPKTSQIWIQIQDGPIKEVGVNGTQIDMIGEIYVELIRQFNTMYDGKFRCRENSIAITKIEEALMWQEKRTRSREKRGVEGFNKP